MLALLFVTACAIPATFADDTPRGPLSIRVGAYENQPKIYSDEAGDFVGLFPDVLNHIAEKEGWQLTYVPGTWSQCLERLERNEIDLLVDVAYSKERAQKYLFTHQTMLINWGVVYAGIENTVDSLIDLKGKKVAVMKASIHTEGADGIKSIARKFDISCEFVEVDSYKDVFELISSNQVDAGVVNRLFGSLHAAAYGVRKTAIIFNPRRLGFALSKTFAPAPAVIERLDHHLRELKNDPDSIYNRAFYVYSSGLSRDLISAAQQMGPEKLKIVLTSDEERWIREHPVIRLGFDPEFAPFEYIDSNGAFSGIASDYIKILNQRLGLNMRVIQNLTWDAAVARARKKEIDVLPCVAKTRERMNYFNFSVPYINFHRVIITRTDTPFLTGLNDIMDLKVGVQHNTSHEGYLRENSIIQPIRYKTQKEALLAVSNGRVEAFVGNIASCTYWIRKLNLTNLKVAAPVGREIQSLHFAVRTDWPELVRIINKGLASITQAEERDIRSRWINVEYEPGIAPRTVWRYVMQIAGLAIVLILIALVWNYRLKKEIKKRIEIDKKLFEANKSLKKLDQLKSMFIASMSHELRTPLNSIIGFTGVILQGMTGPLNDKQKDHLSRVYHSARHLLALITDVIDISKIEAGRIEVFPQDFMLSEVIDEAVMNIQPQLDEKNLSLHQSVPEGLSMHTDRKRLMQCIINYLSNAVKYTETGNISVSVRKAGDKVEILVKDTGIGISEQDKSRLFEAFERLESHLRVKAGGTGLGLYLTRKLATEILGGEVVFRSQEGRGSTFGLLIPASIDEPEIKENRNGASDL